MFKSAVYQQLDKVLDQYNSHQIGLEDVVDQYIVLLIKAQQQRACNCPQCQRLSNSMGK